MAEGREGRHYTVAIAAAYLPISIHLSLCSLSRRTIDSRTDIFMVEQWGARLMSRQGGGKGKKGKVEEEERTSGEVDGEGDDSIDKEKMEKGRGREREERFDVNRSIVIRVNRLPLSSTAPDGLRTQSTIRIVVLYSQSGRGMSTILRNR